MRNVPMDGGVDSSPEKGIYKKQGQLIN